MAKPELYLTSDNDYSGAVLTSFHDAVGFVPKRNLLDELGAIGKRYPHGTLIAVDDQPPMKGIYELGLEGIGMALNFYSDPREALRAFETVNPDAVISDTNMPGMNGFQFIGEVMKKIPQ